MLHNYVHRHIEMALQRERRASYASAVRSQARYGCMVLGCWTILCGLTVELGARQTSDAAAIELWHVGAVTGTAVLSMLTLDEPVRTGAALVQSDPLNRVAVAFRQLGEVWVVGPGVVAVAVVGGLSDRAVERTGKRLIVAQLLNAAVTFGAKLAIGRERPDSAQSALEFTPFHGFNRSFPSGHTSTAFALATVLSDDFGRSGLSIALYAGATLTALSRIYDTRHWLSDTVAGAAVGLASAKLTSGRWGLLGSSVPGWLDHVQDDDAPDEFTVLASFVGAASVARLVTCVIPRLTFRGPMPITTPSGQTSFGWSVTF